MHFAHYKSIRLRLVTAALNANFIILHNIMPLHIGTFEILTYIHKIVWILKSKYCTPLCIDAGFKMGFHDKIEQNTNYLHIKTRFA